MPSEIKYLALEEHLAISYRSVKLRLESTCDPHQAAADHPCTAAARRSGLLS